jgi:hypothetical protein
MSRKILFASLFLFVLPLFATAQEDAVLDVVIPDDDAEVIVIDLFHNPRKVCLFCQNLAFLAK